jgi:hypothetical protein
MQRAMLLPGTTDFGGPKSVARVAWRQVRASVGRCGMEHPRCRRELGRRELSQKPAGRVINQSY